MKADLRGSGMGRKLVAGILAAAVALVLGCQTGPVKSGPEARKQAEASRNLGEAFMADGQYRQALRELEKSRDLFETSAEIHYDLGTAYLCLEQPELALAEFKRAIELNPHYTVAKNSLGATYMALGRYDEAIPVFEELCGNLIYATPQFPLLNLGFIYYTRKDYAKAESYYKKAVEAAPDFAQAWRGLGRTYMATARMQDAVGAFERAVKAAPFFAQAFLELGDAYELTGQGEKAVASWKRAAELSPDSDVGHQAGDRLSRYAAPGK